MLVSSCQIEYLPTSDLQLDSWLEQSGLGLSYGYCVITSADNHLLLSLKNGVTGPRLRAFYAPLHCAPETAEELIEKTNLSVVLGKSATQLAQKASVMFLGEYAVAPSKKTLYVPLAVGLDYPAVELPVAAGFCHTWYSAEDSKQLAAAVGASSEEQQNPDLVFFHRAISLHLESLPSAS